MADYKGIKGFTIPTVSSDPSNLTQGQMWYNSTTDTLKGAGVGVGTWSSANALNNSRAWGGAAGTTGTAAMYFGGNENPTPPYNTTTETEQYDGTSWAEVADLNTERQQIVGLGSQSDAMAVGGQTSSGELNASEHWNGTSWTSTNNLGSERRGMGSGGHCTSSAAVVWGGWDKGPALASAKTETFDGTNWSEANDLSVSTYGSGGAGTESAALSIYTYGPPSSGVSNRWDGTSWTTDGGTLNNSRNLGTQHGGTQTSALYAGGSGASVTADTEVYDGTSWTEVANLSTLRYGLGGAAANSTAALAFGGTQDGPREDATEEWNVPDLTTVTVTTS